MLIIKAVKSIPIVVLSVVFTAAHAQTFTDAAVKIEASQPTPAPGTWSFQVAGNGQLAWQQNGVWTNNYLKATQLSGNVQAKLQSSSQWSFDILDYRNNVGYTNYWVDKTSTFTSGLTYTWGNLAFNPAVQVNTTVSDQRGVFSLSYDMSSQKSSLSTPALNQQMKDAAPALESDYKADGYTPEAAKAASTEIFKNIQFKPLLAFTTAATPYGSTSDPTTYQNLKLDAPLAVVIDKTLSVGVDVTEYYLPDVVGVKATSTVAYKIVYTPVLFNNKAWTGNFAVQYSNGGTDASYGANGFTSNSGISVSIGATYKWSATKKKKT